MEISNEIIEFFMYMLLHRYINVYASNHDILLSEAVALICKEYEFDNVNIDELVNRLNEEMQKFCDDIEVRNKYLAGYVSFVVTEAMELRIADDVKRYYRL